MKKKIFYAAMSAVLLVSCEEKQFVAEEFSGETVALEVRLLSEETKVAGEGSEEENTVSDYQVMIFDMSSRMLEVYDTPDPTAVSVDVRCTTGPKEVVVLANAPDVSKIISYDTFLKTRSRLADNAIGHLVMEGHSPTDLTAAGGTVSVDVKRIVSKVVLDGITVDFEQDVYDNMDFILKKVYLTNVAADKCYLAENADPIQWCNKIVRATTPEVDAMLYEDLGNLNLKTTREYAQQHHFYCYPNPYVNDSFSMESWTERPTRLVVEAMLGNVLYYYPIVLPELEQNTRYYVSLHIVRPGATSPEQDMDKYAVSFDIKIEEWKGPVEVSETI